MNKFLKPGVLFAFLTFLLPGVLSAEGVTKENEKKQAEVTEKTTQATAPSAKDLLQALITIEAAGMQLTVLAKNINLSQISELPVT